MTAEISSADDPGCFDYSLYMKSKGVTIRFKAYMILSDGSERIMTEDEIKELVIGYTYDENTHDDKNFGSYTDTTKNDFSYDAENYKIQVKNVSRYNDEVYKLTANYHGHKTDFDFIMSESEKHETLYTRQVIFKSDAANYEDTTPNVSYFVDSIIHDSVDNETPVPIHCDEYEFTFIILKDKDNGNAVSVYDVRHNGRSIGKSTEWKNIVNDLINVNSSESAFEINEGFRTTYSFDSWLNTSGEGLTASYDYIVNNIVGNITSDLTYDTPIVFKAQLRKNP